MAVTLQIEGADQLLARLQRARKDSIRIIGPALYAEAWLIMADSKHIVPFEQGTLSGSGTVFAPEYTANSVTVRLGYGGAAQAYAVVQHERTDFRHAQGRQAKYLLTPMVSAAKVLTSRLEQRIGAQLFGR